MSFSDIRTIEGDTILSPASPRIRVRINAPMIYLGDLQYLVDQSRYVQDFLFIDVNSLGHVTRMFLVHFMGFLEGKKGQFDYPINKTIHLNGDEYLYDVFLINLEEYIGQFPESDIARAADYIRQRSYTLAGDVVYQRFLHLVEPEKRSEMIIAYLECNENYKLSSEILQLDKDVEKSLVERALSCFTIY